MTEQTPTKLLNKGFISITVINFIVYLVYYLLMVIIAVIAQDSLHATLGLSLIHISIKIPSSVSTPNESYIS